MSEFRLNTESDNIFLVNLSRTGKVLNPLFFKSNPIELKHSRKLKNIAEINPTRTKPKFNDNDLVPYVGLPETNERTQRITNIVLRPYKEVKGRNIIYKNDILFARIEPSIFNKKYIWANNLFGYEFAFTSTEFYIIEQKEINIEYIFKLLFSDFVFNQIKGKTTGSTGRRRLDLDVFKNLDFPVVNNIDYVVTLYNQAYQSKQQKETQAKQLLASIDDYLLNELGITLPEKDNSIENRIFITYLSEVRGGRFDPSYYSFYNHELLEFLNNSKYKLGYIKAYANFISGYAFSSKDYLNDSDCYLITIKNISENEIKLNNVTYLPNNYFYLYKHYRIEKGDLLIAMTGATIGKVGIYNKHKKALINQRNGILRSNEKLNTQYLMALLNTSLYQELILKNSVGGSQPNISETDITKIKIPLPPIEKQAEIANHITNLRNQAKQLELEAQQIMIDAKAEVENIILG